MRALASLLLIVGLVTWGSAQFYGYPENQVPGQARVATGAAGIDVRVDQRLNEFLPLDATFKDDDGKTVQLKDLIQSKPVVILPVFYKCAGVCETELYNLADSLKGFKRDFVGREFDVVIVGIDPKETPIDAAAKKDTVIAAYMGPSTDRTKRLEAEKGWHFLTGDMENIHKTCDALGFKFSYDKTNGSIVHPAGLMVVTPAGKISRYFIATEYPQRVLLDSIRDAGNNRIGVRDDRPFFLACIQIDPLTGQRTMNILNTLKTTGVLTILALGVSIVVWNRKYKAEQGGNL